MLLRPQASPSVFRRCIKASNGWTVCKRIKSTVAAAPVRSAPGRGIGGLFSKFAQSYMKALEQRPVATKALTSAVLFGTADVMAQGVANLCVDPWERKGIDQSRVAKHMAFGLVFIGPLGHYHFKFLDVTGSYLFPGALASYSWVYKVFMAQAVYWSWFQNSSYLGFMAMSSGKSTAEAQEEITGKIMEIQKKNWVYWIPVASVCFACIPLQLQLTYTLSMNLIWSTFLSWHNNHREQENDVIDLVRPAEEMAIARRSVAAFQL